MSVQTFGMAAFRRAVSQGMELAARAEKHIRKSPQPELLNPASLGIVCFRINPAGAGLDEPALEGINRTVLARVFWRRPRIHVFDAAPQDVFPPALHRQPHHDVG